MLIKLLKNVTRVFVFIKKSKYTQYISGADTPAHYFTHTHHNTPHTHPHRGNPQIRHLPKIPRTVL